MKLQSIRIQKLFDLFNYNIELNQAENLTILTAPNGYGKTTILNIVYNLFNQRFFYFQKLKFELISLSFSDGKRIDISKKEDKDKAKEIHINLYDQSDIIDTFIYNSSVEYRLIKELENDLPILQVGFTWMDSRTGKLTTLEELLNERNDISISPLEKEGNISKLLSSINVYIIREQRLLKQEYSSSKIFNQDKPFINTIEDYAKELKELIEQQQLEAYQIAQKLDSSFPKRLIECKDFLSEEEFNSRFSTLTQKQKQLQEFGITSSQDIAEFHQETAKVLTVYLGDSEKKASVFDDLLSKLNLFVTILNEKEFAFKSIRIDSQQGFYFKMNNGQILNLTDLSSGEQQEVVLQYELLFNTTPNTLILIDEPEISLHVIWQKSFIKDLQRIAAMKQISFLVSTHSPQIINDRWDLEKDLYKLANVE